MAPSFSECAPIRVASISTTTGRVRRRPDSGGPRPWPAPRHGRARIARPPRPGHRRPRPSSSPADRGVRGHRAEQLRLGPHHRRVGQAVTAQRDRHRQIQHRLARIVHRPRPARHGRSAPRQTLGQPADLRGLQQQRRPARRNQRLAARFNTEHHRQRVTLHLRSAFQLAEIWTFDKPIFSCRTGTSVHYTGPSRTTDQSRKIEANRLSAVPAEHHHRIRHSNSSNAPSAKLAAAQRLSAASPARPAASASPGPYSTGHLAAGVAWP